MPATDNPTPLPPGVAKLNAMLCGCCTNENTWVPILEELERLDRGEYQGEDGLAAAIVDHLHLSEHGVSIRAGWLTEEGKAALSFLREWGVDWMDKGEFIDDEGVSHGFW